TALAFVQDRIGMDVIVSVGVALEDADTHFEKFAPGARLVKADLREFLFGTRGAAGGGDRDLAVLPDVIMHGRRVAGEPVLAIVLALIGGVRHHTGAVETGAAIEAAFARQIDL